MTPVDAVHPDLQDPTPLRDIYALTRQDRERRVENLIEGSHQILSEGQKLVGDKDLAAVAILYSGGNDSTVMAHLFRNVATHAIHANTGIGVEATREFVRRTCAEWDLPLLEEHPPTPYRDLVLEQGFPGPGHHFKMYQRLKERCLRQARRRLVSNGRKQRVVFLAGRRRAESARRADIPLYEREDSVVWVSPLALWTKPDLVTYRLMAGDVPVNPVSEALGMSGECLCGSFAKPGELDLLRETYPETAREIEALQDEVRAAGIEGPKATWGHGLGGAELRRVGKLCTSCTAPDPLNDLMEKRYQK